jgi:hypothetical protein
VTQFIFILFVIGVVGVIWRARDSARGRAWRRLMLAGFAALVIVTILEPSLTTSVASVIGIGRGTDLVFYLTSFSVMLLAALTYLKFQRMDARIATLTSQLALSEWQRERDAEAGRSNPGAHGR